MGKVWPAGRFAAGDRVRKRSEFQRVQATPYRVVTRRFVFLLARVPQATRPRLGVTASRRVGNAVERNRAKRLVREAFRAIRGTWPAEAVVVVVVRGALAGVRLGDVLDEWRGAEPRLLRAWARLVAGGDAPPTDPPAR